MIRNEEKAFEQAVLRTYRALDHAPKKLLVACSGGIDSMVLLEALTKLKRVLKLEILVAHVHHGPGNARFRKKAWKLVRAVCEQKGLLFLSNSPNGDPAQDQTLSSEAELRDFRWQWLRRWQSEYQLDAVVVAHHYQDLLETRMMRLIRGTGALGLKGMSLMDTRESIFRPLLMVEKARVMEYAKLAGVEYADDPSNKSVDPFRNWIRRWLTELDQRQPNGTRNLARSLSQLVEQLEASASPSHFENSDSFLTDGGIDRRRYLTSLKASQRAHLARYCYEVGIKNYTQGHIEELLKRLDDPKKRFTFELLQCVWSVTPDRIKASRMTGRV